MGLFRVLLFFFSLFHCAASTDNFNLRPKQSINFVSFGRRFEGRHAALVFDESDSDYFKLLDRDGDFLLVGARDAVYNLSMETMEVQHVLAWPPQEQVTNDCLKKGKTEFECHNYIRVMVRQANGRSLICGTHAYSPQCREYVYSVDDSSLQQRRQFEGQAISPFDPRHNSTAVYVAETREIYAGTVSDFAGTDPLIYRKSVAASGDGMRTPRDDLKVLDSPNFVASFAYGEHVYFWYREWASETNDLDRQVYARVARVCKNDRGGSGGATMRDRWTSYVKARLNCSIPSNTPFYFNELQAVTEPVKSRGGTDVVYAVFNTPESSVRMSAVCVFSMGTIEHIFDHGDFKVQDSAQSLWMPHRMSKMYKKLPHPRPGSCVTDSTKLEDSAITFIMHNPLMHQAVPALTTHPVFIQGPDRAQLTQIAVAPQIRSMNGNFNAIYLGTIDGHVLKIVETGNGTISFVESVRVFKRKIPVVNLMSTNNQLVVVSADEVAAVPLHYCGQQSSCSGCVRLQDGYCSWDLNRGQCVAEVNGARAHSNFVQNFWVGKSTQCPEGTGDPDYFIDDDRFPDRAAGMDSSASQSSTSKYILLLLATLVVASTGSFLAGYRISRWRLRHDPLRHSSGSSTGSEYDSCGRARLTRHDSLTTAKIDHVYANPPCRDVVSLVLNMPQNGSVLKTSLSSSSGSGGTTPKTPVEKNLMASFNAGTLPRDYKVKKVYL